MHGVNEARVKLWIDALRSGEYRQARGALRTMTGHCCLGVAQEVALKNGWAPGRGLAFLDWGETSLDPEVSRWFGFRGSDPVSPDDPMLVDLHESGEPVFCVGANDDLDWDFNQIADALEARYITTRLIEQES